MQLQDVQLGLDHSYYCSEYQEKCYVLNSHSDDAATLIIELYKAGDLSGEIRTTEACYLYPWNDQLEVICPAVENQILELNQLIQKGKIVSRVNGTKVAIFTAKTQDGGKHIGWHYADEVAKAGDQLNYHHGNGAGVNKDATYVWMVPDVSEQALSA